jgi:hypothetical protein
MRRILCLTLLYLSIAVPAFSLGHYRDAVQDTKGNAMGNVSVSVYLQGTDTLATLYSDNGVTPKDNPFVTDAKGSYNFYVAQGIYDIVLSCETCYGGRSYEFDAARDRDIFITDTATSGVSGLGNNFDVENQIFNATSALPLLVTNGTQGVAIYGDATEGGVIKPFPLGDSLWRIWTNFNGCIRDMEAGANMFCYDPDAATRKAMYAYQVGYYPLKSFYVSAQMITGDGTQCPTSPTLVTISNSSRYSHICTENNSSRRRFVVPMRTNWDGGVIYIKPYYSQTAADTGSVLLDVAAACRALGTAFNGTYGTEINVDDAALVGSGAIEATLSGAITPNGTCAASDELFVYMDVDATTNPTTAAATLNFLGVDVFYSETSPSH